MTLQCITVASKSPTRQPRCSCELMQTWLLHDRRPDRLGAIECACIRLEPLGLWIRVSGYGPERSTADFRSKPTKVSKVSPLNILTSSMAIHTWWTSCLAAPYQSVVSVVAARRCTSLEMTASLERSRHIGLPLATSRRGVNGGISGPSSC